MPISLLRKLQQKLLKWYREHQRELPWRRTTDPYAIWVSEIMLQQTTVQTVLTYYVKFLQRFPSVKVLAEAEQAEVLKAWEGLGYYRRARSLHQGAQVLVERGGELPGSVEEWQEIPGVGRYTAGAIYSFSKNLPAPIIEANTQRLHARLLGITTELNKSVVQKLLWENAEKWVETDTPREMNYALMELGSQVCKPTQPMCEVCPLSMGCKARQANLQHEIPKMSPRKQLTAVVEWCVVLEHQGKYLLRKRMGNERWAGMWDFFRETSPVADPQKFSSLATPHTKAKYHAAKLFPLEPCSEAEIEQLQQQLSIDLGIRVVLQEIISVMTHHVTRYHITLVCLSAKFQAKGGKQLEKLNASLGSREMMWVSPEELADYPLSVAARALAKLLQPM